MMAKECSKGIKKHISKKFNKEDYENSLQNRQKYIIHQGSIKSQKHTLWSSFQEKIALSYNDDKIYISDGIFVLKLV